jgi:surface antigen
MQKTLTALGFATLLLAGCAGDRPATGGAGADAYAALKADDLALATATMQRALEGESDGSGLGWRNTATGHAGAFTPVRSYVASNGYFCRVYREDLRVGRGAEAYQHEACRNEKGLWVWL